ncbi:MAG: response regulator transcription factor [Candidatus Delongbacteria bacterium]|nr:response regulator transcription factor [Candidatus Delongbacteria bacterium]
MTDDKPNTIISALVVDDEELARRGLLRLLAAYPQIRVVGEAADVDQAVELIHSLKPQLLFLDIQLRGETGFEVLDRIDSSIRPVFVTAFDQYAVRAFEVNAVDYLLKPVNPERFAVTMDRILSGVQAPVTEERLGYDDSVFILLERQWRFLKISTIVCIQAEEYCSRIFTDDGHQRVVTKLLKDWERRLPEKEFTRIHRSVIINLNAIDHVEKWFDHSYRIYMKHVAEPQVMSRRYAGKIKQRLRI